jgi:hypothetical protein
MIIFQNLAMVPQIIHNVKIGNNPGFNYFYIFGYLTMRMLVPLYERGCPDNHFLLAPDDLLVSGIAFLYVFQVLSI